MLDTLDLPLLGAPHRLQGRFADVTGAMQASLTECPAEGIERQRPIS
jgi:hypothetical protein